MCRIEFDELYVNPPCGLFGRAGGSFEKTN